VLGLLTTGETTHKDLDCVRTLHTKDPEWMLEHGASADWAWCRGAQLLEPVEQGSFGQLLGHSWRAQFARACQPRRDSATETDW
jgi:hypothetical protein